MSGTGSFGAARLSTHPSPAASAPCLPIDSNIPLPKMKRDNRKCGAAMRTFHALEVGESFVFPAKNGESIQRTQHRASGRLFHLKPKKFSTRQRIENGVTVIRVWRVK